MYLAVRYRDTGYDDGRILDEAPFAIAGPLFGAIDLWSTHALAEIARMVGADPTPMRRPWRGHTRPSSIDFGMSVPGASTHAMSSPTLSSPKTPSCPSPRCSIPTSEARTSAPSRTLSRPVASNPRFSVPTFNVNSPDFERRRYWRGPIWLNTNWLIWSGLRQHGLEAAAERVASSSLRLVEDNGFREYFDPLDGTGYGTTSFGWSAALTIDLIERLGPRAGELL